MLAFVALGVVAARPARAEEKEPETADGPGACEKLEKKNARELADWEKQQPAVPYQHRREEGYFTPWGRLFEALGASGGLFAATFVPHGGAQLRGIAPAAVVSWPWSIPFGPGYACTRRVGSFFVRKHRVHRAVIEPGFNSGSRGVGFHTRLAYRLLWHPTDWVVGIGGGVGANAEIFGNREPFRVGVGPEGVAHFGHCCEPSYVTFAIRYDRFFTGSVADVLTGTLGYTFF